MENISKIKAGFAETDITPPIGVEKVGWMKKIISDRILDQLGAHAVAFECDKQIIAFLQLDILSIPARLVAEIRKRTQKNCGLPPDRLMVSASHNHAGPAVSAAPVGDAVPDPAYVEKFLQQCVSACRQAFEKLQPATIGFARGSEARIAWNRRTIMRDGTVKTHGLLSDPLALCPEGPIDPELAVLAARDAQGKYLGCLVNFTCHPTDHGGDTAISAGYPGVMARRLKTRGMPAALFLNGACGNISTYNTFNPDLTPSMETVGQTLADDVSLLFPEMKWRQKLHLAAASATVPLPFRTITEDEIKGTTHGAYRAVDSSIYDRHMPALCAKIKSKGVDPAEVQVFFMDELAWVGIPAEYFVQHGLRIKEQCWPAHALIVGHANGMVGYVPHKEAFAHGGYETTFGGGSRLAPETGDLLADAAIKLVKSHLPEMP